MKATSTQDPTKSASATITLYPITISLSPITASVQPGGTLQLNATITGEVTANKGVIWIVNGVTAGNSTVGTTKNIDSYSTLYTAPATIPNPATIIITATPIADQYQSVSASITITTTPVVNISISPTSASVKTIGTQAFSATVTGTSNTTVTWKVNNITGGNSTLGTISTSGLYNAPSAVPNPASVTVSAVSAADNSKSASATVTISASTGISATVHGVTVTDDIDIRQSSDLNNAIPALTNLSVTPTARLVFTLEGSASSKGASASSYLSAVQQIKNSTVSSTGQHPYLMGQPVDSSYMLCFGKDKNGIDEHNKRWDDYLSTLGQYVDVWEVGNEINGNWLYKSGPNVDISGMSCPWTIPDSSNVDVVNRMIYAYNQVKQLGKKAALTLMFCPTDLTGWNDPFAWVDTNIPADMLSGMDYVLISYYYAAGTADCAYGDPSASDWVSWFKALQTRFPNAKLGIGEWGFSTTNPPSNLTALLQEGYSINPKASLTNPAAWIGGVFYWNFASTAIPWNNANWNVVNTALVNQK